MATILLLEDEIDLREEIADFLKSEGYQVLEATNIAEFTPLMHQFDIAIIDVGLPDGDGLQVASNLRSTRPKSGIVMLTAQSDLKTKISSLSESADFYLVKPVSFEELLAHMQALQRRVTIRWRLDLAKCELISPDAYSEVLNSMEFALVKALAKNAGKVVTRRAIAEALEIEWHQLDDRRLDQIVSRLRRRWSKTAGSELPIRTDYGKGFTFSTDIDVI